MKRTPLRSVAFVIDGENHGLDEVQLAKLNKWLAEVTKKIDEKHRRGDMRVIAERFKSKGEVYAGSIGGNLTFSVTPTNLGTGFRVSESITGEKIDLSDYDNW